MHKENQEPHHDYPCTARNSVLGRFFERDELVLELGLRDVIYKLNFITLLKPSKSDRKSLSIPSAFPAMAPLPKGHQCMLRRKYNPVKNSGPKKNRNKMSENRGCLKNRLYLIKFPVNIGKPSPALAQANTMVENPMALHKLTENTM